MPPTGTMTFSKEERLCSKSDIERLFNRNGSRSMAAFPLRLVYMRTDAGGGRPLAQVLVSVSKRHFKHAVKRNRVKRQVREAYRLSKHILYDKLGGSGGQGVAMAFIWLDDKTWDTAEVKRKMANLMQRLAEKIDTRP